MSPGRPLENPGETYPRFSPAPLCRLHEAGSVAWRASPTGGGSNAGSGLTDARRGMHCRRRDPQGPNQQGGCQAREYRQEAAQRSVGRYCYAMDTHGEGRFDFRPRDFPQRCIHRHRRRVRLRLLVSRRLLDHRVDLPVRFFSGADLADHGRKTFLLAIFRRLGRFRFLCNDPRHHRRLDRDTCHGRLRQLVGQPVEFVHGSPRLPLDPPRAPHPRLAHADVQRACGISPNHRKLHESRRLDVLAARHDHVHRLNYHRPPYRAAPRRHKSGDQGVLRLLRKCALFPLLRRDAGGLARYRNVGDGSQ
mmetsp:Transcript_101312/g.285692  ORF Transcript_101312/g.285692 Transcript_101312/m.285692 type:complete len:306 (-) Transcript_101312:1180-2097(-)